MAHTFPFIPPWPLHHIQAFVRGCKIAPDSPVWKCKEYFCLGSSSVSGISMPASVLKWIHFSICTIHETIHLNLPEGEAAGWTPQLWEVVRRWLSFREMHRTMSGERIVRQQTCSSHFHRVHTTEGWREKALGTPSFYLTDHRRDHISHPWGLINNAFVWVKKQHIFSYC